MKVDENINTLEDLISKWVPKGVDITIIVNEISRDKESYLKAYSDLKAKRIKIYEDVSAYIYRMVDLGLTMKYEKKEGEQK